MKHLGLWSWLTHITRGFILGFHDIDALKFEELVDAVHPIQIIPLSELVALCKAGKPTMGLCAITVDDGIAQTTHGLAAVCRKRNWPVTFYLPTSNIDNGAGFAFEWWRQIRPFLAGRKWNLSAGMLDLTRPESVQELATTMERLWHTTSSDLYLPFTMELVNAVSTELQIPIESLRPLRPLMWSEVETLSRDPLLSFESHGFSHTACSALTQEELVREMRDSRDSILEHTGRPTRHFCYPFGSAKSIGSTAAMASRFFDSAVTMSLGHVDGANPWLLPRIPLYPENSASFAQTKVFLKCARLSRSGAHSHPPEGAELATGS